MQEPPSLLYVLLEDTPLACARRTMHMPGLAPEATEDDGLPPRPRALAVAAPTSRLPQAVRPDRCGSTLPLSAFGSLAPWLLPAAPHNAHENSGAKLSTAQRGPKTNSSEKKECLRKENHRAKTTWQGRRGARKGWWCRDQAEAGSGKIGGACTTSAQVGVAFTGGSPPAWCSGHAAAARARACSFAAVQGGSDGADM